MNIWFQTTIIALKPQLNLCKWRFLNASLQKQTTDSMNLFMPPFLLKLKISEWCCLIPRNFHRIGQGSSHWILIMTAYTCIGNIIFTCIFNFEQLFIQSCCPLRVLKSNHDFAAYSTVRFEPASGDICCLLITFANSFDPDQATSGLIWIQV